MEDITSFIPLFNSIVAYGHMFGIAIDSNK